MTTTPHHDDAAPLRWEDLDGPAQRACVSMLVRLDDLQKRATALDARLRALLAPDDVDALGVAGLRTQWDEDRLAAFEALVALIPNSGGPRS